MHSKQIKKNLFLLAMTGALLVPGETVSATDEAKAESVLPGAGIETVLKSGTTEEVEKYLAPLENRKYANMAFANVDEGSYLYIRSQPTTESEWIGKLYQGYAAKITGPVNEWTQIQSGNVSGYVKTEFIQFGTDAEKTAESSETSGSGFAYAESKEEEEARLLAEAQAQAEAEAIAQEQAVEAYVGTGQSVVDYACQFLGNPYVWGGTSLTGGADCSGFVQSVYANFGVSMPRTSGEMRGAGMEVSYDQALPGDVICYDGHVGIYMGDGQIVNAIDESHGIGISNATFTNIITVRRML